MPNRLKILRSTTASVTPPVGAAADYGRLATNLTDRKIWAYGPTGTPTLIASFTTVHNAAQGYTVGDLVVQNNILYRCTANIGPKAFSAGDWQSVSDFRDILLYRAPTSQAQATVNIGAAGVSFRINANAGQSAPLQQWRDSAGVSVAEIRPDGYPGEAFGRPVFRVDQVAHSFTAIGQPARFDGANWVLADASTEAGFAIGIVRRIISANAFEIQTNGRIDGLQNAAFIAGSIAPNTRYYVSTVTPGTLTSVAPPNATEANVVLHTLTGGSGIINVSIPLGAGSGGGSTDVAVTQANPFTAVGQIAGYNGAWGLASGTSATNPPLGLISAVAGNDFTVSTAGLITGIQAAAAVVFPLTPGQAYYCNAAGLLTATPPTGTPVADSPVLWAVSGDSGIIVTQPNNPNVLRPSQNLGDLTNVTTAITNLGLSDVVRNTRTISAGTGLTGGGNLSANRTIALSAGSIASLALADTAVQPARSISAGTGLTGGGNLSANRTLALTGQALALHNLTGAGLVARTGTDTFAVRSVAAGNGITVSNGAGTAGNPTIAVDATIARSAVTLTAGAGLTGGGNLSANRTFAVDATVVRTSGNQTIAGEKTFTSRLISSADLQVRHNTADQGFGISNEGSSVPRFGFARAGGANGAGIIWRQNNANTARSHRLLFEEGGAIRADVGFFAGSGSGLTDIPATAITGLSVPGWQPFDGGTGLLYEGGVDTPANQLLTPILEDGWEYKLFVRDMKSSAGSNTALRILIRDDADTQRAEPNERPPRLNANGDIVNNITTPPAVPSGGSGGTGYDAELTVYAPRVEKPWACYDLITPYAMSSGMNTISYVPTGVIQVRGLPATPRFKVKQFGFYLSDNRTFAAPTKAYLLRRPYDSDGTLA